LIVVSLLTLGCLSKEEKDRESPLVHVGQRLVYSDPLDVYCDKDSGDRIYVYRDSVAVSPKGCVK